MNSESEQLAGHAIDKVINILDVVYLCAIGLAAVLSVLIFLLSSRSLAAKDRALEGYKKSADLQIAEANEQAQVADAREAKSTLAIAEAQLQIAKLNSEAAHLKAASIVQSVAEQQQRTTLALEATELKKTNLSLGKQLAERHLTAEQAGSLVALLEHFKEQKVIVEATANDAEAVRYAQDFIHVLRAAKWHVTSYITRHNVTNTIVGLQIRCNPHDCCEKHWLPSLVVFPKTLYRLGLVPDFSIIVDPEAEQKVISLLVGSRP